MQNDKIRHPQIPNIGKSHKRPKLRIRLAPLAAEHTGDATSASPVHAECILRMQLHPSPIAVPAGDLAKLGNSNDRLAQLWLLDGMRCVLFAVYLCDQDCAAGH